MNIAQKLANEFQLKPIQTQKTIELIKDGNTVPFIARYRKEVTGGLDDVVLRDFNDRLAYLENLEDRKQEVIKLIEEQGKLTEELRQEILDAEVLQRVEDLYKPYKKKKATRASKAKEKGLEPLADIIFAQEENSGDIEDFAKDFVDEEKGVADTEEAIAGALDIIAEYISDDPDIVELIREKTLENAFMETTAVGDDADTVYEMYFDYSEPVSKIPNHRILAINRGEKENALKVKVKIDIPELLFRIEKMIISNDRSIFHQKLLDTIEDSYKRLLGPAIEREVRNILTERAEEEAVKVFAKNTESLLMIPPVRNTRVLAIDPGFRTGCKVAVLDETGKLLDYATIYPTEPRKDILGAQRTIKDFVKKYKVDVIAIGNGTASRETEEVVADLIAKEKWNMDYTIVNEAGASVYSASKVATEEYPDLDVTTRGAMSLGKRLQDPLAELVKISPKHIGVGQYQHDINQGLLDHALSNVVENCVNRVGVDLNTASPSLLAYIAGINAGVAKSIVSYREANGDFTNRKQLKKVPKLGDKAYAQCAGFLRVVGGDDPLDSTAVHPESYKVADALLKKIGLSDSEIQKGGIADLDAKLDKDVQTLAQELNAGVPTLTDIIDELKKPGRDPREDAPPVVFRKDVKSFDDLKEGMELTGTVRNVVDFGAFVDIGVKNDGLVHISQLSDKFVDHPTDIVSVGDTVKVRIINIDRDKGKVGLSMKL